MIRMYCIQRKKENGRKGEMKRARKSDGWKKERVREREKVEEKERVREGERRVNDHVERYKDVDINMFITYIKRTGSLMRRCMRF